MHNEDLDRVVICPRCQALHEIVALEDKTKAHCVECNTLLYQEDACLSDKLLAISLGALLFFIISNTFMIIQIDLFGNEEFMNIPSMIFRLYESGFYIVGLFLSLFLFILPLLTLLIYLLIALSLKFGWWLSYCKNFLIVLSNIKLWNMIDIFLISILIAMVKLVDLFALHLGIAFYSLIIYVLLDIYLSKSIKIINLWRAYEARYKQL